MKFLLLGGVAVNAGDLLKQIPTIVLVVIVFCSFVLVALVLSMSQLVAGSYVY
jgi:hypothetical protein